MLCKDFFMIKRLIQFCILVAGITAHDSFAGNANYPYQKPERFNSDYQKSNYYLAGDIFFYTDFLPELAPYKHLNTNSPLINPNQNSHLAQFTPNKKYNLFSMFYKKGQDEECIPYTLPKPIIGNSRIIFYSPDMSAYPTILINRNNGEDWITIYVGNPNKKGLGNAKLIFNIDNFEKYMKTTAWYNSLDKLGEKVQLKDSGIIFGFAANIGDFSFNIPNSIEQNIHKFSINFVEIVGAFKWATCPKEKRYQYIKNIIPFTDTTKINEPATKNSINDLYESHTINWNGTEIVIPPIITISPLDSDDFKKFNELVKLGNTN